MTAIAAGHALTAGAGHEVLRAGGSAVDACIAACFMAFVAEPVLAQPLGGGFLMAAPAGRAPRLLDGFVRTPRLRAEGDIRSIEADFGTSTQVFHIGAGTIAVPGLVPMLFEAHERLGRIPMAELAAPAVRAAREGVAVSEMQASIARIVTPILAATAETAALHLDDGAAAKHHRNPALADALEVLAIEGSRLFTEGEVAQALCDLPGAVLTPLDLRRHTPRWRDPLEAERAGTRLHLTPVPSITGAALALALDALPRRPDALTIAAALQALENAATLPESARAEALSTALARHAVRQTGTTQISAIDREGNGAALTVSNGAGAGLVLPGTGIMPNNMLGEEDLLPDGPESWPLDTRLGSAMCPLALHDAEGGVTLLGSGGSSRIRSALLQVLLQLTDGARLEEAIAAPRLHVEKGRLAFEPMEEARDALLASWPEATEWPAPSPYFGGVHAVRRTRRGAFEAAADARRDGAALM
ncbi:gamma-glutamyltransferase [Pontivivens ytuae]|uniref:Gamma-glutamyltransferase n=1 Tax=Pontivivens ytuae TaxID=2789856 RepID=A0A7S9LSG9_9RHOB|nr:gamma-glutamyltransferase [Pontivivens ytuae]QPH54418.1 gamma-glutamyltransferase [Pontivivens ytuae]